MIATLLYLSHSSKSAEISNALKSDIYIFNIILSVYDNNLQNVRLLSSNGMH